MALNTLPAGAFADDAITSAKINLANTFAFTGTVTGAFTVHQQQVLQHIRCKWHLQVELHN